MEAYQSYIYIKFYTESGPLSGLVQFGKIKKNTKLFEMEF